MRIEKSPNSTKGDAVRGAFYLWCNILFFFIVKAKIIVTTALAVDEKNALNHTPFSFHMGVRINKKHIGNTSVPKKDVIRERAGRSSAVK